jgi:hypothetical protein
MDINKSFQATAGGRRNLLTHSLLDIFNNLYIIIIQSDRVDSSGMQHAYPCFGYTPFFGMYIGCPVVTCMQRSFVVYLFFFYVWRPRVNANYLLNLKL